MHVTHGSVGAVAATRLVQVLVAVGGAGQIRMRALLLNACRAIGPACDVVL